jgi:hypothetical protein
MVQPWADFKGRRGTPKRVVTEGYACPSARCAYYGVTDSRVHALVGYGRHGATDRIQDFRCQARGTKVSARRRTALCQRKTRPARVGEILIALAEGLDVAAAVRAFGHGAGTIARWQARAAQHAERLHGPVVAWPAVAACSAVHLGPRTQASAHALIHALTTRLTPGCVPL